MQAWVDRSGVGEPWAGITLGSASGAKAFGLLHLLAYPLFLFTTSAVLVLCKWLVVGEYVEGRWRVHSWYGLRWWFVDTLFRLWERTTGQLIADTVLANIVMKALGADVPLSASVSTFVRCPDLFQCGERASLDGSIYTELVQASTDRDDPSPVLRTGCVTFGSDVSVPAFSTVLPNSYLADSVSLQRLTVCPEGSMLLTAGLSSS